MFTYYTYYTSKVFIFLMSLFRQTSLFHFSILGMNLFGCKFCDRDPITKEKMNCDRKNFDSLLWATVTVFQVFMEIILDY